MDISEVQKKLKGTQCPNCNQSDTLQAMLICSRDEETCKTACQCSHCHKPFSISVPESLQVQVESKMICSLSSSECSFEDVAKKAA